ADSAECRAYFAERRAGSTSLGEIARPHYYIAHCFIIGLARFTNLEATFDTYIHCELLTTAQTALSSYTTSFDAYSNRFKFTYDIF
ncbi:MAG: hypothetical protein IIY06_01985, partial [Proteobacteria bacterium]|nr:hypothetical protein [Pseudomonadota bacterium]